VGIVFVPELVVNDKLFVRLMVRGWPVGTVITTGDQVAELVAPFDAAQVAVDPVTAAPQL
jgi:hypothetical protein